MKLFKWYYRNTLEGYSEKRLKKNPLPIQPTEKKIVYVIATILMPISLPIDLILLIVRPKNR